MCRKRKECCRCISFDSYIKPQPNPYKYHHKWVVYLLIPTSNHNRWLSPTTHYRLYIFWFLHQTTTASMNTAPSLCCISFDSYIKPQPATCGPIPSGSCISFDSYIKPQQIDLYPQPPCSCISFDSYIKPQPGLRIKCSVFGCISFDSYIKPQLEPWSIIFSRVVYLLIPTSNHNVFLILFVLLTLYIFWFLHQTTTTPSPSLAK